MDTYCHRLYGLIFIVFGAFQLVSADLSRAISDGCPPAQVGSRLHILSKILTLNQLDVVKVKMMLRPVYTIAECRKMRCRNLISGYRTSVQSARQRGQYEVKVTIMRVRRIDETKFVWSVNGREVEKCDMQVYDFKSNVACDPSTLTSDASRRKYVSLTCRINHVYPAPGCEFKQVKSRWIVPDTYVSSKRFNTDHYNLSCTMRLPFTMNCLQEYEVTMYVNNDLRRIKGASSTVKVNLNCNVVTTASTSLQTRSTVVTFPSTPYSTSTSGRTAVTFKSTPYSTSTSTSGSTFSTFTSTPTSTSPSGSSVVTSSSTSTQTDEKVDKDDDDNSKVILALTISAVVLLILSVCIAVIIIKKRKKNKLRSRDPDGSTRVFHNSIYASSGANTYADISDIYARPNQVNQTSCGHGLIVALPDQDENPYERCQ